MTPRPAQPPAEGEGAHLVLFDGVCGLCNGLVQFLLRYDRRHVFSFASLQSAVGRRLVEQSGGNPDELTSFYVVADYQSGAPRVFTRSDAAMFVAGALGWPWKSLGLIRAVPTRIRDGVYDFIGRNRYRVFGRYDRCLVPDPAFRSRFID